MKELPDELVISGGFVDKCYIVTIQGELKQESLDKIGANVLQAVYDTGVRGVILDFSGVAVFDSEIFAALKRITRMIDVMGVNVVWIGLKPGVASALVDLNVDINNIKIARNLENGLELIKSCMIAINSRKQL